MKTMNCILLLLTLINTLTCNEIKPVLHKCCGMNEIVARKKICINSTQTMNFSQIQIFDYKTEKTEKTIDDTFVLQNGRFQDSKFKSKSIISLALLDYFNFYLTEDAILYLEIPNAYNRWTKIDMQDFCMDFYRTRNRGVKPAFYFQLKKDYDKEFERLPDDPVNETVLVHFKERFHVLSDEKIAGKVSFYAMMISCCFLLAVLIVYASLRELRNLSGVILLAFVASILVSLLQFGIIGLWRFYRQSCIELSMTMCFFTMASFCWLNIMSFDIWWTLRDYVKAQTKHRRREILSFAIYSIYSWGLPLGLTLMLAWIESMDLTDKPWIIKPNLTMRGCVIDGGEKLLYFDVPVLILICISWIFLLMTAFKIRAISVLESTVALPRDKPTFYRTHRNRFHLYLKLTTVMTVNWFFEFLNNVVTDIRIWYLNVISNTLIGVSVFLIFVYKRKIIKRICNLIPTRKKMKKIKLRSLENRLSILSNKDT